MAIREPCKLNRYIHDSQEFLEPLSCRAPITISGKLSLTILVVLTGQVSITLRAFRPGVRQAASLVTSAANISTLRAVPGYLLWPERTSGRSTLFLRSPL